MLSLLPCSLLVLVWMGVVKAAPKAEWSPFTSTSPFHSHSYNMEQQLFSWALLWNIGGLGNADNMGSGYGSIRPTFGALYNDPWNFDAIPYRYLGFPEGPLYENSVPQVNSFQLPSIMGTNLVTAPLVESIDPRTAAPTLDHTLQPISTEYAVTPLGEVSAGALMRGTAAETPFIAPSRSGAGVGGPIFTGLTPTVTPFIDTRVATRLAGGIVQTAGGPVSGAAQVTGTSATTPFVASPRSRAGVAGPLFSALTPTVPPGAAVTTIGTTAETPLVTPPRSGPGVGGTFFTGLTPTVPPERDATRGSVIETPIGDVPATAQLEGTSADIPQVVPPRTGPGVVGDLTALSPTLPPGYTSVIGIETDATKKNHTSISTSTLTSSSSSATPILTPTSAITPAPITVKASKSSFTTSASTSSTRSPPLTRLVHTISQLPVSNPIIYPPFIPVLEHAQYHPQTLLASSLSTPLIYGTHATVPLITPARSGASVSGIFTGLLPRYPLRFLPLTEISPATGYVPLYELFAPSAADERDSS